MDNEAKLLYGRRSDDEFLRPTQQWISVGSVVVGEIGPGCPVGCVYCNQMGMDKTETGERLSGYISLSVDSGISLNSRLMVGNKVDKKIDPIDLVDELVKKPYYTTSSPIILENYNDPGIDWGQTARMIESLTIDHKHTGPISFITKMGIKDQQVRELARLRDLGAKIISIVTYSGMPKEIEKSSSSVRLGTMRKLKKAGIPVIASIRPLVEGINATDEVASRVLTEVSQLADTVIVGGLFVYDDFTVDNFAKAGYPLPDYYGTDVYSVAKYMPRDYKTWIRGLIKQLDLDILVHNHTSCAIADLTTRHYKSPMVDRFAHWVNHAGESFHECDHCPKVQKNQCQTKSQESFAGIAKLAKEALLDLGYSSFDVVESMDVEGLLLVAGGSLSFEELAIVTERCGWTANNLPSFEGLKKVSKRAIEVDLSQQEGEEIVFSELMHGAILVGQSWHVFVKNCSSDRASNVQTWLRSRNRHRVMVHHMSELQDKGLDVFTDKLNSSSHNLQTTESIRGGLVGLLSSY